MSTLRMGKKVIHILALPLRGGLHLSANTASSFSEYGLPMDDQELDRMDLCHTKYYHLLKSRRFLSPIGENPQRILDLGCGTGSPAPPPPQNLIKHPLRPLADIGLSKGSGVSRWPMIIPGHKYGNSFTEKAIIWCQPQD